MGRRDIPLTAEGREQAVRLGELVRDRGLAAVYASYLRRAVETAELAARGLGLDVRIDPRLAETDKGAWEAGCSTRSSGPSGDAYDVLRHATTSFRYPGGESLAEHLARVTAALRDVARGPLPALVVCHAGTVRCALALADPDSGWRRGAASGCPTRRRSRSTPPACHRQPSTDASAPIGRPSIPGRGPPATTGNSS